MMAEKPKILKKFSEMHLFDGSFLEFYIVVFSRRLPL